MVLPWHPFMCKSLHTVDAVLPQFFIETALIQDKLGGVVLWQIPKAVQLIELNWRAVVHWQARTYCIVIADESPSIMNAKLRSLSWTTALCINCRSSVTGDGDLPPNTGTGFTVEMRMLIEFD